MVREAALTCSEALHRSGFWYAKVFGEDGDHGVINPAWGMAYMTPEWLLSRLLPAWRALLYEPCALEREPGPLRPRASLSAAQTRWIQSDDPARSSWPG
jgi:hypothetical protein